VKNNAITRMSPLRHTSLLRHRVHPRERIVPIRRDELEEFYVPCRWCAVYSPYVIHVNPATSYLFAGIRSAASGSLAVYRIAVEDTEAYILRS
jgi:hypothetical protein